MGFRSGDWLGHSRTLLCFSLSHSFVALAVCFESLSCWKTHPRPIFSALTDGRRLSAKISRYMAPFILPSIRWSRPVPLAEKHPQSIRFPPPCFTVEMAFLGLLHYNTCHLVDAFIQSDLQLIKLSRIHTPWSNVGLRALLKSPTAVQILSWPHQGSNHRPCGSKSSTLTTMLQPALYSAFLFLQTRRVELMPNSSILVSSDHITFSQASSGSSSCSMANFRRACTCAFFSRGTLRAQQDFNPSRCSVLLMVLFVTVVPTAYRSLTSSSCVVLGWSLTFLIIIDIPQGEILHGAPDRGRLADFVLHFLIIAPTVVNFSPSCLLIFL